MTSEMQILCFTMLRFLGYQLLIYACALSGIDIEVRCDMIYAYKMMRGILSKQDIDHHGTEIERLQGRSTCVGSYPNVMDILFLEMLREP